MMLNDVANLVCKDEECKNRILPLLSFFMDIENLVKDINPPKLIDKREPLIDNVSFQNRDLEKISQYPEEVKSYIIARVTAEAYSNIFDENKGKCPICGSIPKALFLRKSESDLYSGYKSFLRCICGYEIPWEDWKCPSCGNMGRDNFDTFVLNDRILIKRCLKCGFKTYSLADFSEKLTQLYNIMIYKIDEEVTLPDAKEK